MLSYISIGYALPPYYLKVGISHIDSVEWTRDVFMAKVGQGETGKASGSKQGWAVLYQPPAHTPQVHHGWEWTWTYGGNNREHQILWAFGKKVSVIILCVKTLCNIYCAIIEDSKYDLICTIKIKKKPGGKNKVPTTLFCRISILRTPGAMYQRSTVTAASSCPPLCRCSLLEPWLDGTGMWPSNKDNCTEYGVSTFFFRSLWENTDETVTVMGFAYKTKTVSNPSSTNIYIIVLFFINYPFKKYIWCWLTLLIKSMCLWIIFNVSIHGFAWFVNYYPCSHLRPSLSPGAGCRAQNSPMGSQPT